MKSLYIILIIVIAALVIGSIAFVILISTNEEAAEENTIINENNLIEEKTIEEDNNIIETPAIEEPVEEVFNLNDVIDTCNSLCRSDAQAYCSEERTIVVDGEELSGTCRAFAKKGAVEGFNRCQGFCQSFPKSTSRIS